ncbi:hypothetical protein NCAS_0I01920 [Naumovozyma castellii]|uniref:Anaphase-promoting complex subunit 11 n=1 Tax=Naumovozyma castellii TaxID=27288 RepID=G0VK26_NAUCA|nr:hypothetical protein NCAS_0I01920 [Naumovozyma castellii CBS 4309]CCC71860.1 hypothetical protein NCAS_0I01920 [Naumovozyma castellii CBS 4309]
MKLEVREVYPVFEWSWDITSETEQQQNHEPEEQPEDDDDDDDDEVCGICRAGYNAVCPSCSHPGVTCPVVVGTCQHAFHVHCVVPWLATAAARGACPMCRQPFALDPLRRVNRGATVTLPQLGDPDST